jgi:hypothetical protein
LYLTKFLIDIELTHAKVADVSQVLSYLPNDPAKHCDKDFLFTVINTLDSGFFPKIESEIEK